MGGGCARGESAAFFESARPLKQIRSFAGSPRRPPMDSGGLPTDVLLMTGTRFPYMDDLAALGGGGGGGVQKETGRSGISSPPRTDTFSSRNSASSMAKFDHRDAPTPARAGSSSLARDRGLGPDPSPHISSGTRTSTCACCDRGIVGDTHQYGLDVPPRPTVL